jgi:hypothetical protein
MATLELDRHLLAPEIHCRQAYAGPPPARNLRQNRLASRRLSFPVALVARLGCGRSASGT